jgi:hypothetical protein
LLNNAWDVASAVVCSFVDAYRTGTGAVPVDVIRRGFSASCSAWLPLVAIEELLSSLPADSTLHANVANAVAQYHRLTTLAHTA